jgi:CRP-like cAMP-binding protein
LLLSIARPVSFLKGAILVRNGESARGAYVLRTGNAEAAVTLPGGDRLVVARIAPGGVFGEMALVERGYCTATVVATEPLEGWFLEREDFRALVAQRHPAARRLQHALTLILAEKLQQVNARVLECPAPEDCPARVTAESSDSLSGLPRSKNAAFDSRAFLPKLPLFGDFEDFEIDEVIACASVLELERGRGVFAVGEAARACFIVVRGAVEITARHRSLERRLAVLGPGQLFGFMAVLEGRAHGAAAKAREVATLLELAGEDFRRLYESPGSAATKLRHAIHGSLLASLGHTNRTLTRLISMARLHGARREGDALQAAYCAQIVAAAQPSPGT